MFELDTVEDDSLTRFLPRWYGPPDRPPPPASAVPSLPPSLPSALDEWYRLAARWSLPICRDHVFRAAGDLDLAAELVDFWSADDGSDQYAYDAAHQVFEQGVPTGIGLRRFLVYIAVFEAVYAPIHGLVHLDVPPDVLAEITGRLLPLADPLWQWPDPALRYFADDDLLVHAGAGRLVVSARHRDALGRFDGYGLDWMWDSRVSLWCDQSPVEGRVGLAEPAHVQARRRRWSIHPPVGP